MSQITKKEAQGIAKKLEAKTTAGKKHERAEVYVDDQLWASFGYSHGKKNSNIQITSDLGISYTDAVKLARCQLAKDWYFDRVREKRRGLTEQKTTREQANQ